VQRQIRPGEVVGNPELGIDLLEIRRRLLEVAEPRILADMLAEAAERGSRDHRADIVEDQPADRRLLARCQHHADQPSHRRADQVDLLEAAILEERVHVLQVGRVVVLGLVGQPAGPAAADHVDLDHPVVLRHGDGEAIEIPSVAGQRVDADHHTLPRLDAEILEGEPDGSVMVGEGEATGTRTHC